jgi:hypothetical protein
MKKNILLVQSFLVLPLMTTSSAFGMQQLVTAKAITEKKELSAAQQAQGSIVAQQQTAAQPQPEAKDYLSKSEVQHNKVQHKKHHKKSSHHKAEAPKTEEQPVTPANTPASTPTVSKIHVAEDATDDLPELVEQVVTEEQVQAPITLETTESVAQETAPLSASATSKRAPMPTPEKKSVIPTVDEVKARMANVFKEMPIQATPVEIPSEIKEEKSNWDITSTFYAMIKNFTTKEDVSKPVIEPITSFTPAKDLLAASVYEPQPIIRQSLTTEQLKEAKNDPLGFIKEAFELKTFDPEDKDHMKLLTKAAEQLVLEEKVKQLKDLLDACRVEYPNIKLEKKVALQIRKRFTLHEENTRTASLKDIDLENKKYLQTQNEVFTENAALISALTQKLERNNATLAMAHASYMLATNDILKKQTEELKHSHDAKQVLGKLYRKPNFITEGFNSHSLNLVKSLEASHNEINYNLEHLNLVCETIHSTIGLIKPETKQLQIDNK